VGHLAAVGVGQVPEGDELASIEAGEEDRRVGMGGEALVVGAGEAAEGPEAVLEPFHELPIHPLDHVVIALFRQDGVGEHGVRGVKHHVHEPFGEVGNGGIGQNAGKLHRLGEKPLLFPDEVAEDVAGAVEAVACVRAVVDAVEDLFSKLPPRLLLEDVVGRVPDQVEGDGRRPLRRHDELHADGPALSVAVG
jgi:hypothetical protein